MTVGSLFAGIGGFDLGLERAGLKISWQVEIDPYCQRVLAKHWPNVTRYGDIRAIDWAPIPRVDVLCGGFPCQDLSFAGKRAGIDGERSGLWSEYVRAIRALRPRFILVENVPGLLTNAYMGRVLGDLASCGYDAEWDCLPAAKCGAPHKRERVWIIANSERGQLGRLWDTLETEGPCYRNELLGNISGLPWREAIARLHGVDDGVPNRAHRNRALGNAIVPQIAEWLGRQIMKAEAIA